MTEAAAICIVLLFITAAFIFALAGALLLDRAHARAGGKHRIVVYGDSFAEDSPRIKQLAAYSFDDEPTQPCGRRHHHQEAAAPE